MAEPSPIASASPSNGGEQPALAHIEKTLTESYRKEIDQEENIWRSLPFFAATLALQLAALFQVIERVPVGQNWPALIAHLLAAVSVGCSLGGLAFLASSIFPAKFRYIAKDTALLDYALGLIDDEQHPNNHSQPVPVVALVLLKKSLAMQYALATDNNRQINKRRERRRSIAGLLTLSSIVSTILLVGVTFATYIPRHDEKGIANGLPARFIGQHRPADGDKHAAPTPAPSGATDARSN